MNERLSEGAAMSASPLSAPKVVLLAANLISRANINGLSHLASHYRDVLQKELVLRLLLTYLPETIPSQTYVPFLQDLASGEFIRNDPAEIDSADVDSLLESEATRLVRKLRLLPLTGSKDPIDSLDDPLTLFLFSRAHRVDAGAGLLSQLPALFIPFLEHTPSLRPWVTAVLIPLLRRNYLYYPNDSIPITLKEFQKLPDAVALSLLLSPTGTKQSDLRLVGRDLRGLVGPWLQGGEIREHHLTGGTSNDQTPCHRFEAVQDWLISQTSKEWRVAVEAVRQWQGPADCDLGNDGQYTMSEAQREYLQDRYLRTSIASAYLIPDSTLEALSGAHAIASSVASTLHLEAPTPLHTSSIISLDLSSVGSDRLQYTGIVSDMRNDLLNESNLITQPDSSSLQRLCALIFSAFLLTNSGLPCNIRRAGELAFLQDSREQRSEATKFIQSLSGEVSQNGDEPWITARKELLWLRSWGASTADAFHAGSGVFGSVSLDFIETEFLKALLASSRKANCFSNVRTFHLANVE